MNESILRLVLNEVFGELCVPDLDAIHERLTDMALSGDLQGPELQIVLSACNYTFARKVGAQPAVDLWEKEFAARDRADEAADEPFLTAEEAARAHVAYCDDNEIPY